MKTEIAIADDHQLFLKSLGKLVDSFDNFSLVADAVNGSDLLQKLPLLPQLPDIVLLDVNMPVMDGPATAMQITTTYPQVKVVALSMKDDDHTIIRMIRSGCCAYLLKDIHPDELEKALHQIHQLGYYNADESNLRVRRLISRTKEAEQLLLSDREKIFLRLACSDLTYKQIADQMHLAERTIDGYREHLFEKLQVQSRVGMVLKALREGLVQLDDDPVQQLP
ncbi:two component transcriptional regulator, LuxR family [Cnuella takakiae]|uniref:Two component transcriptional regulator, LuxR family n=1 Tax=Cnuella takakiae TaxID=1302690 RepID=A0A1M5IK87_9BACT|nr:response regulator transcription factor [Cnuella takakiae]OLY92219.1 DNA-binding response regulator [Cnuella takakiae]SHG28774.1 two component transcriptional regulator, LuxR family [Cnuella takakiae]